MAGKSIDDILRQQAAQRQAEIQRQQAQERALNEQREMQRQDYLNRNRIFEALSNNSTNSAAGAGGIKKVTTNLNWIESALASMNLRYSEVTNLIPNIYNFWDDYTTTDEDDSPILSGINDGGDDMYDGGNYMNTNLTQDWEIIKESGVDDDGPLAQASILYTHTQSDNDDDDNEYFNPPMDGIVQLGDSYFGTGSKYFTNMYPGLFLMVSDNISISEFNISGNVGSDGDGIGAGSVDSVIPGWTLFYKTNTDSDNSDPSINQLILIPGSSTGVTQEYDTSSEYDDHRISGIDDRSRIVYIVVARQPDEDVLSEEDAILVAQKILEIIL